MSLSRRAGKGGVLGLWILDCGDGQGGSGMQRLGVFCPWAGHFPAAGIPARVKLRRCTDSLLRGVRGSVLMASPNGRHAPGLTTCLPPSRSIHLCFHSILTITTPPAPVASIPRLSLPCGSLQNQLLFSPSWICSSSARGCPGGCVELSQHDSAAPRSPGPGGLGPVSKPGELVQSRPGRKGKFL